MQTLNVAKRMLTRIVAVVMLVLILGITPAPWIQPAYSQDNAQANWEWQRWWENKEFEVSRDMDYIRIAIDDCNVRAYTERLNQLQNEASQMEGKLIEKYGRDDANWPRDPNTRLYDRTKDMISEFVREWERRGCVEPKNWNKHQADLVQLSAQAEQLGHVNEISQGNDLYNEGLRAVENCDRETFYRVLRQLGELLRAAERKLQESIRLGIYLGQHGHYENYYNAIRHLKDLINRLNEAWRNQDCSEKAKQERAIRKQITDIEKQIERLTRENDLIRKALEEEQKKLKEQSQNAPEPPKTTQETPKKPEEEQFKKAQEELKKAQQELDRIQEEQRQDKLKKVENKQQSMVVPPRLYMEISTEGNLAKMETVAVLTDEESQTPEEKQQSVLRIPYGMPTLADMAYELYGTMPQPLTTPVQVHTAKQEPTKPVQPTEPITRTTSPSVMPTHSELPTQCLAEVEEYKQTLRSRAHQGWRAPKPASKGRYTAKLQYDLLRNGQIERVRLVQSSGDARIDQSALEQIKSMQGQFSPLPSCYREDTMGIDHDFTVIYQ